MTLRAPFPLGTAPFKKSPGLPASEGVPKTPNSRFKNRDSTAQTGTGWSPNRELFDLRSFP